MSTASAAARHHAYGAAVLFNEVCLLALMLVALGEAAVVVATAQAALIASAGSTKPLRRQP
eukprot:364395-Chlamydomonas_euryale.AAC.3